MNVFTSHSRPKLLIAAALFSVTLAGCHRNQPTVTDANNTGDPAEANLAASDGTVPDSSGNVQQGAQQPLSSSPSSYPQAAPAPTRRVLGARAQNESQQQAEEYPQQGYADNGQGAPIERRSPEYTDGNGYNQGYGGQQTADTYDQGYNTGMDAVEEADQPPPPLPVYDQPPCPEPNYLWTPGYWNYAPAGYYWVPGAWTAPPYSGALWTPGYWGYGDNRYRFHRGFWGPHIGFYGGVAYGFGYTGYGYQGGYWNGNNFYYNRSVSRVNTTNITNVYNRTVIINNNTTINRVSYNGGNGGIQVQPRPAELAALRETRVPPMASQVQLRQTAAANRQQFFSANQGRPATVAAARPLAATPGIPPPAVRLASANAPRPAAMPGRPNLPQQQQVNQQRVAPQQPANQQRVAPQQQQAARPAEAARVTPQQTAQQQRLNTQQQAQQQRVTAQQQAQQQRLNTQQQANQQRVTAQQQAQQQRLTVQQQQQAAQQQRTAAAQQARPAATPQRPVQPEPQTRPELQERPQPSRPVTPQPAPRPTQPTVRPTQPAPRTQTAAPHTQSAPAEQARPAEGRPH